MRIRRAVAALPPVLILSLALSLPGCGDSTPPKPAAAPADSPAPAPVAAAPAAAAPAAAVAPVAQEAKPDPDKELAQRVKHALESEEKIQGAGIDVTAKGDKVTLWGTTASDDERTRAGRIAYRVEGVAKVDNKLVVVKGS